VHNCTAPGRTEERIAAQAQAVEDARAGGSTVTYQRGLGNSSCIKGYSLFFAPSLEMRTDSPYVKGDLKILQDIGPNCTLLPPRSVAAYLGGAELASLRAVLAQEAVDEVPQEDLARNYYRMELASRKTAGARPAGSDCDKHLRRNFLLRVNSTELVHRRGPPPEERPVSTFAVVLHYAAVLSMGFPWLLHTWSV